jgi:hypothetical protein
MENNNILIIDGQRYFYDIDIDNLIPIDDFDIKQKEYIQTKKHDQIKSDFDDYYPNCSLEKFKKVSSSNKIDTNDMSGENLDDVNEWYMENYDIDFWENLLSRKLYKDEQKIIHGIWNESALNVDVKVLQKNIIKHNCYIKNKTNNIGNCLFESLASLGLGDNDLGITNHVMIRKSLAIVLLMVKTEIGFFSKNNLTPEEIFTNSNEIEFVQDKKTGEVYIYDYDMMIYDLNSSYSWERLPTEFILMALSKIYQVEIRIYHNSNDFVNRINVLDDVPENIIRLGQINEEHYFPLLKIPDELKNDSDVIDSILNTNVIYDKFIKQFKKWSKIMMDSMGHIDVNCKEKNELDNYNESNTKFNVSNTYITTTIMKSNKLTTEQFEDYKQISNIEDFDVL